MATTRLSDVIYGPLFMPTVINRIAQLSKLRASPVISRDPQIDVIANGQGNTAFLPFWNDLTGNSNASSDDPAVMAVPGKITQGQDQAIKIRRNNGWEAANLVSSLLLEDPLDVIASLVAGYWVREEEVILGQIMSGVFADSLMAGNKLDVAAESTGAAVKLDADIASNAYALLGEYGQTLTAVLMHSRVFYNLRAAQRIVYKIDPETNVTMATWDGLDVFVSDACPRVAGTTSGFKYTSYLFGTGAIAYSEITGAAGPEEPVELSSVAAAGNGEGVKTMWFRRHWIMHPRGVAFDGTPAGASVTNAELANGANWTRKYDPKLVRLAAVVTNG